MKSKYSTAILLGWIILLGLPGLALAQRPIKGTVKDEKGKGIAYARVMIKSTTIGTVTDTTGKFSLMTKGPGPDTLVVTYLGYTTLNFPVAAGADASNLGLKMKEVESTINDVVITAGMIEASNESNVAVLKPLDIVTTAGSQGDIAGAIQTLPGVQRNGGDQTGLMVRGGDVSETAVIVDGTVAQNAFGPAVPGVGARSRFNPFQFKGTAFSSGGYSVRYGQAMSSVLDLQTNDLPDESTLNLGVNMAGVFFSGAKKFDQSAVEFSTYYSNVAPFFLLAETNVDFYAPPTGAGLSGRWVSKVDGDKGIFKMNFNQTYSKVGIEIPDPEIAGEKIDFLIKNEYTFFNASFAYWLRPTWKVFTAVAYSSNNDDIAWGAYPSQRADSRTQARG
ncbi:MAG TPA: carboxypeptidase-like regulatory domain-containing protein, partial [Bacteroidia bacterium]|nr:carboxypeptidase-like regulatory domain-containing protein [Bacteroidia bacterium]